MKVARVRGLLITLLLAAALTTAGCHGHRPYRTVPEWCNTTSDDSRACPRQALIRLQDAPVGTLLGFVEFDDQGAYWDRPRSLQVLERLAAEVQDNSVILVAFAHGWKHNARASDQNLESVLSVLAGLARFEACIAEEFRAKPRSVVGVYLGWRGGTLRLPGLKELTFWGRKKVAHKVGESAVQDVMLRLEQLYLSKRLQESDGKRSAGERQRSFFISLGHSFGGALLFSALNPMLLNRAYEQARRDDDFEPGFGDLIVLVNPAFEARRFTELAELASERAGAVDDRPPVLATFSSEADWATRYAFPIGRWLGTLSQRYGAEPGQRVKNINTLGHYRPYITHRLEAKPSQTTPCAVSDSPGPVTRSRAVDDVQRVYRQLKPGGVTELSNADLKPVEDSRLPTAGPYIVVEVARDFIDGHSDFANPRFQQFLIEFLTANAFSNYEE